MQVPQHKSNRKYGFNMTPMIDVVFLLIIFFLVVVVLSVVALSSLSFLSFLILVFDWSKSVLLGTEVVVGRATGCSFDLFEFLLSSCRVSLLLSRPRSRRFCSSSRSWRL